MNKFISFMSKHSSNCFLAARKFNRLFNYKGRSPIIIFSHLHDLMRLKFNSFRNPISIGINKILGMIANVKMLRVYTELVIALVKSEELWRNLYSMKLKRESMGRNKALSNPTSIKNTISTCFNGSCPKPTCFSFVYHLPKTKLWRASSKFPKFFTHAETLTTLTA